MTRQLVLLHGFTQTAESWQPVTDRLGERYNAAAIDLPGHGTSSDLLLDMPGAARWLAGRGGRSTYVGYSMGGRLALHLALAQPTLVERLVLVSTTAGIPDEAERAARRAADEKRAQELERDGVAAFIDRWLALPLFAGLRQDQAQLDARLANTAEGLSSSLRLAGTGAQESLWPRLSELAMHVLIVAGQLDAKFAAIAEQMADSIPKAELAIVPAAGHVVQLERPDEFVEVLLRWLDSLG